MSQLFLKFRLGSIAGLFLLGVWILFVSDSKELGVFFIAISFLAYYSIDLFITYSKSWHFWRAFRKKKVLACQP